MNGNHSIENEDMSEFYDLTDENGEYLEAPEDNFDLDSCDSDDVEGNIASQFDATALQCYLNHCPGTLLAELEKQISMERCSYEWWARCLFKASTYVDFTPGLVNFTINTVAARAGKAIRDKKVAKKNCKMTYECLLEGCRVCTQFKLESVKRRVKDLYGPNPLVAMRDDVTETIVTNPDGPGKPRLTPVISRQELDEIVLECQTGNNVVVMNADCVAPDINYGDSAMRVVERVHFFGHSYDDHMHPAPEADQYTACTTLSIRAPVDSACRKLMVSFQIEALKRRNARMVAFFNGVCLRDDLPHDIRRNQDEKDIRWSKSLDPGRVAQDCCESGFIATLISKVNDYLSFHTTASVTCLGVPSLYRLLNHVLPKPVRHRLVYKSYNADPRYSGMLVCVNEYELLRPWLANCDTLCMLTWAQAHNLDGVDYSFFLLVRQMYYLHDVQVYDSVDYTQTHLAFCALGYVERDGVEKLVLTLREYEND